MYKNIEKALPIEWEECDGYDYDSCNFQNVTFTSDFGDVKEGDKFTSISIDFQEGFLQLYQNDALSKIIHFKCVSTSVKTYNKENDKI